MTFKDFFIINIFMYINSFYVNKSIIYNNYNYNLIFVLYLYKII